jgi:hypothetical protein
MADFTKEIEMRISQFIAAVSISVVASGPSLADTPVPHQKPGLWESSMTMMGKNFTTESCVTPESEAKMSIFSSQIRKSNCSSNTVTHNMDGSWTSTSTCKFGDKERTSHARVTGDFNSKVTMVLYRDDNNTPETTITMTWNGACKPGMKGGDVVMSNGMKMNVLDGTASGMPSH